MVASAIFILDVKGKPLIARDFRGDIPMTAIDQFMPLVMDRDDDHGDPPPIVADTNGVHYLYMKHNNLYFVALTRKNSNAATIFLFLQRLTEVFSEYFKQVEEESIRDNFVIIYELLDEMMDFGYPQTTESKVLREYITQQSYKLESATTTRPPIAVTNAVSWRTEGIKYRKNEVFLDVIESVNSLISPQGNVLRSEILGAIKMRCFLSGMPELRLGLNDKVLFETSGRTPRGKAIEMDDVKFHQCVRLARFDHDRTISFIPPDGEFELMSYRLGAEVKPLISVETTIENYSGTRVEYLVLVKANFKRRSTANNVEILVPVPEDADTPKLKVVVGSASYHPEKSAIIWKIKHLQGGMEFQLRATLGLPTVKSIDADKRPPIQLKFEIPYFTISGIQVRYLKIVEKSGYAALPWVRYITQNGDAYHVRQPEPVATGPRAPYGGKRSIAY
ncbi:hypothetical protein AMAG_10149 [Allomyces macrogynus ATCC 38327]|uniref:MHD domain-containing protein n=1 Tax=Allomyces macrogynus (strain ATCC 38327) TaxID=578462 RepID=A0A0L0SQM2_ALLM3|nr:hypothetical protein AMAG_10149 [Allomyces macrogynus ATCC 38327]|eukprot:KNE64811.1 hypothetical protein AMAG_10149 [Allomyces macrogynus ATCC 38327]